MSTQALVLRDAIFTRVQAIPGFTKVRKTLFPQIQPTDLPLASVYISRETMTPDGDDNAGPIAFVSNAVIAISTVRGFDDPSVLEGEMDADIDAVEAALFLDPEFTRLAPDGFFEGVSQITRQRLFPRDGETYFAELRMEITFVFRVEFDPTVSDDFKNIHVTARPLGHDDAPPVEASWDIPQT